MALSDHSGPGVQPGCLCRRLSARVRRQECKPSQCIREIREPKERRITTADRRIIIYEEDQKRKIDWRKQVDGERVWMKPIAPLGA